MYKRQDRTNAVDSPEGIRDAANALSRQLNEVVIPEIDMWRLQCMAEEGAGSGVEAITASNAYSTFLSAMAEMTEKKVPVTGRVAFVTPAYYSPVSYTHLDVYKRQDVPCL